MKRRALVLTLVLALVGAACAEGSGGGGEEETTASGSETETETTAAFDAETVTIGASLAQVRGHHDAALKLYEEGDTEGAAVHASHPVAELLPSLGSELEEHGDGATDLEASVQEVADLIAAGAEPEEVAAAAEEAALATESATEAVAGTEIQSSAYVGSVIASLLATTAHEYEEAVGDEGLRLFAEYQDGYAFAHEAQEMYDRIRAEVEETDAEEAAEIDEAWETLDRAFPVDTTLSDEPDELLPTEEVVAAAELIGHELEEVVGALPAEEADHEEVLAEIEELLAEIEETYPADPDAAAELSAEAYLENYEVIEADVIEMAPEINEELEPLLGADLRAHIEEGVSEEEIAAMIDRARELLDEVEAVLAEAH